VRRDQSQQFVFLLQYSSLKDSKNRKRSSTRFHTDCNFVEPHSVSVIFFRQNLDSVMFAVFPESHV